MSRLCFSLERRGFRFLCAVALAAALSFPASVIRAEEGADHFDSSQVSSPFDPYTGQLRLSLQYGFRTSNKVFDENGFPGDSDPESTWTVHQLTIGSAYGLSRHTSVFCDIPFLYSTLNNSVIEAPLSNPYPLPGDVSFGFRWRVRERRQPYSSLSLELSGTAPTGLEISGDPGTTLLTGTGIPELQLGAGFRSQFGMLHIGASMGYTARISKVVAYAEAVYPDGNRGDARFHPGNRVDAGLSIRAAFLQRLWLMIDGAATYESTYRMGTTQALWFPSLELDPIPDTEGFGADAGATLAAALSERAEFQIEGRYRFLGRTLPEFSALGLEAFSPAPGLSINVSLSMLLL